MLAVTSVIVLPPFEGKPSLIETDDGWAVVDADGNIIRDGLSHAQAWDLIDWFDPTDCQIHDDYLRARIALSTNGRRR